MATPVIEPKKLLTNLEILKLTLLNADESEYTAGAQCIYNVQPVKTLWCLEMDLESAIMAGNESEINRIKSLIETNYIK